MHLNVFFVFLFTDDIVSHPFFIVFENVIFCVVRLIQQQPGVLFFFVFVFLFVCLFETVEAKWKNLSVISNFRDGCHTFDACNKARLHLTKLHKTGTKHTATQT